MVSAGLMGFSILIVQVFVSRQSFDAPVLVSTIAFAVSIPMLVFHFLLNELFNTSRGLNITKSHRFIWFTGIVTSIAGIIAAFWHVSPFASGALVISGITGLVIFINNDVRVKNHLIRQDQIDRQNKELN
jgi:hypothetical protein